MPKCSIIIPVYNRVDLTRQCLQAIQDNTSDRFSYEIIVADDGSTDATPQLLATYGDHIRVVTLPKNSGFSTACNEGATIATGEYLVFLNNDIVPQPGWLEALVDYAITHRKATIVSSKLVFPEGTIQHAGGAIHRDRLPILLYHGFPKDHPAVNKSRRCQIVTAACILIRQNWFYQVGGFDPAFRNGFEDIDLCLRVGEKGGEVHYCHHSVLLHLEGATCEDRTLATDEYRAVEAERNRQLYLICWDTYVQVDDLGHYLEDRQVKLIFQEVYDRIRETYDLKKEEGRLSTQPLKAKLRAFIYSEDTLPLWFSIPRYGMAVMLIFAQMYRERKKVVKT